MDMKAATLMVRYKAADGTWQRGLAATAANGRIRSGYVLIDGQPVQVEKYVYQVRRYKDGQAAYEAVGKNASEAEARRQVLQRQMAVQEAAPEVGLTVVDLSNDRKTLQATGAAYIKLRVSVQAFEAAEQARLVTSEFLANTKKRYVDEVTTEDITRFHGVLRKRGLSDRTVANKDARLASWLKFAGLDKGVLRGTGDAILPPKPKYEAALPTIYERDQISTLLSQDDPYMRMAMSMALKLGLREQELMHAEFRDVNWSEKTYRVQGKMEWGFKVKAHEQRDIPIADDLYEELLAWRKEHKGESLILGTSGLRPNTHLLRALKRLAKNADLNCGHCGGCQSDSRECEEYTLHKFRRTYITTLLRSGIDLRTVQAYAGHKDLASTMRYLRPASGVEARARVNAVQW